MYIQVDTEIYSLVYIHRWFENDSEFTRKKCFSRWNCAFGPAMFQSLDPISKMGLLRPAKYPSISAVSSSVVENLYLQRKIFSLEKK